MDLGWLWGGLWAVATTLVGLVMFAAQIGPDEARSNLSKWVEKAGIHSIPRWLRSRKADRFVLRWGKWALVATSVSVRP